MSAWLRNIRFGFRLLAANKGFATVAILALALGIGPNTAIFSVVWGVMLAPLPFPNADRMVVVWSRINGERGPVPADDYQEYIHQTHTLTAFGYSAWSERHMMLPGDPEPILGGVGTGNGDFSGIPEIQLGSYWLFRHATPGNDRYVILNHRLWVQRFHSDPGVIGKQVLVDDEPYTIIAVRIADNADKQTTQFNTPLALTYGVHDNHWGDMFARLKPGVSIERAQAELATITRRIAANHPADFPRNWGVSVEPFHNDWLDPKLKRNFWLLMASVGFVLLIACANVANLLLARGVSREKEIALRAARGASRTQLFSQLLSESLVLAGVGGALGVGLGWALMKLALALLPSNVLPIEAEIGLNWPVLLFTLGVTLIAGCVFGCAPALQSLHVDLNEALKSGLRTSLGGRRAGLQSVLVIGEFGLALTLLAGAGLAIHSFWNLASIDLGFRTDHILTARLRPPHRHVADAGQIREADRAIVDAAASVPGVRYVAFSTGVPLRGHSEFPFSVAGQAARPENHSTADLQFVTPAFVDVFQLRVVRGRFVSEEDRIGTPRVVVVSESFARRYLPHMDPLAARLLLPQVMPYGRDLGAPADYRIVGVVNDVHNGERLTDPGTPSMYTAFWQSPFPWGALSVRSAVEPGSLSKSMRQAVLNAAPSQALTDFETMDKIVGEQIVSDRFGAVLYGGFSAVALILAAVGIYGLMSFAVAQRRHEIGLRMALGARPDQLVRLVLRDGLRLALIGLGIGLAGAYAVGRVMHGTLYGVASIDAASLVAVSAILLLAALLANYLPAWRATRVDPLESLRQE